MVEGTSLRVTVSGIGVVASSDMDIRNRGVVSDGEGLVATERLRSGFAISSCSV